LPEVTEPTDDEIIRELMEMDYGQLNRELFKPMGVYLEAEHRERTNHPFRHYGRILLGLSAYVGSEALQRIKGQLASLKAKVEGEISERIG
jgi:hypothetical protein